MRVRKVNSEGVKIHDSVQVKLKTAGNTQVVQFTAGNNKSCPVRNLSKDTYLDTSPAMWNAAQMACGEKVMLAFNTICICAALDFDSQNPCQSLIRDWQGDIITYKLFTKL